MQIEILAIVLPIIFVYIITSLVGYRILTAQSNAILATFDQRFELATNVILSTIDERIQVAIDNVSDALGEIFEKPIVKQSMTMLGERGNKVQGDNAMMERIATDVLNGPKLAALKTAAKMGLGIDIDSYIEEEGAVKTLENLQGLASLIGIDVGSVLQGGMSGMNLAVGHEANDNPYRRR